MTVPPRSVALCLVLIPCFTSGGLADDFKTISGKEYKNAKVSRVETDGIVLKSKSGITKVYFTELPKDVQERFHYAQATPSAAQPGGEPINVEAKQSEFPQAHGGGKVVVVGRHSGHRQADGGGRVVVVGQSAGSLKIFIAGIVVLAVVVLAVVRSRF